MAKPLPPTSTPAPTEVPNGGTVGNIVSQSPGGYLNQQVEDADENRYNTECTNLTLQYAINVLDEYLKGNVSEEYAQSCVQELAKIGALYENEYIKSVKKYKSDFKNRDYDQFDTQIIGWVAYYNYKSPEYSIDPEWVKAMLYVESVYSYSSNPSPNANASVDIMQTLDPRNSTIYTYVNVDIMQTYVAGPGYKDEKNPDYRVTVGQIRELNKLTPISQENVGGNIIPLAQTLFSFENDKYYYQYSNATQFMSLGIEYTLCRKSIECLIERIRYMLSLIVFYKNII